MPRLLRNYDGMPNYFAKLQRPLQNYNGFCETAMVCQGFGETTIVWAKLEWREQQEAESSRRLRAAEGREKQKAQSSRRTRASEDQEQQSMGSYVQSCGRIPRKMAQKCQLKLERFLSTSPLLNPREFTIRIPSNNSDSKLLQPAFKPQAHSCEPQ